MSESSKPGEGQGHGKQCECLLCDSRRVLVETGIDRNAFGEAVAEPSRERRFPIQSISKAAPLSISWSTAELAYSAYSARYGRGQSLERLAERGGFSPGEMDMLLPDWREREDERAALKARIWQLEREIAEKDVNTHRDQDCDAHNVCFMPVSDWLEDQLPGAGVPCYEDVLPAIKALLKMRAEAAEVRVADAEQIGFEKGKEAAYNETFERLENATLHRLICNADHSKPIGGDFCVCNPLKGPLFEARKARAKAEKEAHALKEALVTICDGVETLRESFNDTLPRPASDPKEHRLRNAVSALACRREVFLPLACKALLSAGEHDQEGTKAP